MKIFYDVDTQNDFMNENGALYVPDAELIIPNLYDITKHAIKNSSPGIAVVGSVDKHFGTKRYKRREKELARWGGPFPDHCMDGTEGQKKIIATTIEGLWHKHGPIFNRHEFLEHHLDNHIDETKIEELFYYPEDPGYKFGVYFEKQSYDVFKNPQAEYFLKKAKVKEAIVYGVATDVCVRAAVLGMQKRRIQCYVVEDAIKGVFPDKTEQALEEMAEAGAKFVKTADVLGGKI